MLLKVKDYIYFKDDETESAYIYNRKENVLKNVIPKAVLAVFEKNLIFFQDKFRRINNLPDYTFYEAGFYFDYDPRINETIRFQDKTTNKCYELDREIAITLIEMTLKEIYEKSERKMKNEEIIY